MEQNVKSRLREFIETLGISISKFERSIGVSTGFVNNISKGIGAEKMQRISQIYPELNRVWLLYGEGEMLVSSTESIQEVRSIALSPSGGSIPLFDVLVAAGTTYGMDMAAVSQPFGYIDAGGTLAGCTLALRVYGDSMAPEYPKGSVVGAKEVTRQEIEPSRVYVIETDSNRYLKRLYLSPDGDELRCISDNHEKYETGPMAGEFIYPEFTIPLSIVRRLFVVKAVVEIKGM